MALNNLGLGLIFTAKNLASPVILKINRDLNVLEKTSMKAGGTMGKIFKTVVTSAGLASAAVGITGLLGVMTSLGAASVGGRFEQGIAKLGNISMATGAQLKEMGDKAFESAIKTQFSPDEAIAGMTELAQQGFAATEAMAALDPVLDIAAGGQISVAQASATVGAALNAFGLNADQATFAADRMFRATQTSALKVSEMEGVMGKLGRTVGIAGQSLDNMLISVGFIRSTGVPATEAANAVSRALVELSKKKKDFKALGVEVTDVEGRFRSLPDILFDMEKALSGTKDQADAAGKAYKLLGRFGIAAFSGLRQKLAKGIVDRKTGETLFGLEALQLMKDSMKDADGAAKKFRDDFLNTFTGQGQLLRGAAQGIAVAIGEPFAQVLKPIIGTLVDVFAFLAKNIRALPGPLKKMVAGLFVATSAILLITGALGLLVVALAVAGVLMIAFFKPIMIFLALSAALLGPIMVMVAALGLGLGTLVTALNQGAASGGLLERLRVLKLTFSGLIDLFSGKRFSKEVSAEFAKADSEVAENIRRFGFFGFKIIAFFKGFKKGFLEVTAAMGPTIDALVDSISKLVKTIFGIDLDSIFSEEVSLEESGQKIGTMFAELGEDIIKMVTTGIEFFTFFAQEIRDTWNSIIKPNLEFMGDGLDSIVTSLDELFGSSTGGAEGMKILAKAMGLLFITPIIIAVGSVNLLVLVFRALLTIVEMVMFTIKSLIDVFNNPLSTAVNAFKDIATAYLPDSVIERFGLNQATNRAAPTATSGLPADQALEEQIRNNSDAGRFGVLTDAGRQLRATNALGITAARGGAIGIAQTIADSRGSASFDPGEVSAAIATEIGNRVEEGIKKGIEKAKIELITNIDGQRIWNTVSSANQSNAEDAQSSNNTVQTELG